MRYATCIYEGKQRIIREEQGALTLLPVEQGSSLRSLIEEGALDAMADLEGEGVKIDALRFLPPITDPDKILCIGFNYRGHVTETGAPLPEHPSIFVRFPSSQVGHNEAVVAPSISSQFDFEGELAVVIGKAGWRVSEQAAMDYVAGYTCFAENSVRDFQAHAKQATAGKNFLRSGAIGPWLTTADEVPDPSQLELTTRVNGEVMQHTRVSSLVFNIPKLIAYISSFTELLPGDIISTGTPDGVGLLRNPQIWLKPGDTVEVEIPGVGLLVNRVISENDLLREARQ